MVLKLIALGPVGYTKSMWNIFDGLVVLMSIIDVIIEIAVSANNGDFTIIRSLRLVKFLNFFQTFKRKVLALLRIYLFNIGPISP